MSTAIIDQSETRSEASGEDVAPTADHGVAASSAASPGGALLSDAKRYRKRAQAAEQALDELRKKLVEREQALHDREQAIADLQRRQSIDQQLAQAKVIDVEAGRALVEATLQEAPELTAEDAIDQLRRRKPHLFARRGPQSRAATGALAPKTSHEAAPHETALQSAASDALSTGKRADLLRYLRLRRR